MYRLYNHNIWNCSPPEDRNTLIRTFIKEFDADFCTFQECSPTSNRLGKLPIQDLLSDKYTEVGTGMEDYTPVFYKTERFNLIDSGYLLFDGKNDCNSKSVTWAVVEDKSNKKRFCVMSTHFWWEWNSVADELQRVDNAKELKSLCEEVIAKHNVPIIVGGDFNNGLNSPQGDLAYRFMLENNFRDVRLIAANSSTAYTCREECKLIKGEKNYADDGEPDITIDYIFIYGKGLTPVSFNVDISERAKLASDHLPLLCEFEF